MGPNLLHHFQARWPKFGKLRAKEWNWNAHIRIVDNFRVNNSNYKKFDFFSTRDECHGSFISQGETFPELRRFVRA